ncbi:hypothetical protein Tco_1447736 [Tanacetum coccineum]
MQQKNRIFQAIKKSYLSSYFGCSKAQSLLSRIPDHCWSSRNIHASVLEYSYQEIVSFNSELGYTRNIETLHELFIDNMHQPWRTFAAVINRCISGKTIGLDKLRSTITSQRKACPIQDLQRSSSITSSHKTISSKELTKKPGKAKKDVTSSKKTTTKPKLTKKKEPVKADIGKGLNVLLEVTISKVAQLKEVTKRSKKELHISHASGLGDGTDFESGVPDEQQCKISGIDEGTGAKPGVLDVPKYESKSDKESWGDSGEEDDDDKDDTKDDDDNDDNDDDGDNDDNDDDSDHERTESDRNENPNLNQSNEEHEEEEEECVDEFTDKEDDANNVKEETKEELDDAEELYRDANVNLWKEDEEMTDADQAVHDTQKTEGPMESSSVSSDFTEKLLNFENVSPANNEIASLMDTIVHHEEPSDQTSSLFTVPITVIPEITSTFTTTIPLPPPPFNPLLQQATPTPTPKFSEATTSFLALLDFSYVFKFNDRVTNLERDLSEMKQVDQYAQDISSIPFIVDRYINNKLGEGIQQAIKSHTAECREEALADMREYIDLIDILQNITKSLKAVVLTKSSSQPKSTYEATASLSEEPKSKESKSISSSKGTSRSQHKSSGKSAHAEESSHTVDDSGVKQNQEFDTGNNDEQPDNKVASKEDWYKKPKQPPTLDPNWNKRQQVDFRPSQTWISNNAHAKKHPTSFDELMDTPINFSAFVMNRLNITNLTQELLRLSNLIIDECFYLNVALGMFTRRIVIQRRVEDLQLGVKSYQKKLNLTKPDTLTSDLRNKTAYTTYSDPQGVIYKDQNNRNRLMRIDKLHKFSDGTLNYVRTALHDITSGIRMEYLPKKK